MSVSTGIKAGPLEASSSWWSLERGEGQSSPRRPRGARGSRGDPALRQGWPGRERRPPTPLCSADGRASPALLRPAELPSVSRVYSRSRRSRSLGRGDAGGWGVAPSPQLRWCRTARAVLACRVPEPFGCLTGKHRKLAGDKRSLWFLNPHAEVADQRQQERCLWPSPMGAVPALCHLWGIPAAPARPQRTAAPSPRPQRSAGSGGGRAGAAGGCRARGGVGRAPRTAASPPSSRNAAPWRQMFA